MTTPTGRRSLPRSRSPLPWMLAIAAVVGVTGAAGVIRAANQRTADVERVTGLEGVLSPLPGDDDDGDGRSDRDGSDDDADDGLTALDRLTVPDEYQAVNYLLVGSDSREGVDTGSEDFGVIGDQSQVGGRRSDTIMVLRQEENGGAALVSLPRDLWVEIPGAGRSNRINAAYNEGPDRLVATVVETLGIPIHHYVEVDFNGFKQIIDELDGVEICVGHAARDVHSGLAIQPGCQTLDGEQALAFARSRHYEEWDGRNWVEDPRADLGRIERQQFFLRSAADGALRSLRSSPFSSSDVIDAVIGAVRIDEGLDPIDAGGALRAAVEDSLITYTVPVYNDRVGDAAVLRLAEGSSEVLDYLRGQGPRPIDHANGGTEETDAD